MSSLSLLTIVAAVLVSASAQSQFIDQGVYKLENAGSLLTTGTEGVLGKAGLYNGMPGQKWIFILADEEQNHWALQNVMDESILGDGLWMIKDVGNGKHQIQSVNSLKCLRTNGRGNANSEAECQKWSSFQRFTISQAA